MAVENRRNLFGIAMALFLSGEGTSSAQAPTGAKELARHPLTGAHEGMEAILVEVTARPGVSSMVHRHPGFVLGYVLDGTLKFAIDGTKPEVVNAGSTFFEPLGALHTVGTSANPNAPVRFLAFIVAPKGSPVTLPA